MACRAEQQTPLLSITDLAILHGLSYQVAHARLCRGEYGQPVRLGRRLFVRVSA